MSLWVRFLQTEMAKNDATGGMVQISFKDPWMVFKYVSIGLFLVFLCGALLREYLYYRWGIDCCLRGTRISSGQEHQLADQRSALELLEEEMAHKITDARRQERRRKYEQFLAPYTMVIKREHLYYAVDKMDGKREMHPLVSSNSAHLADNEHHEDHDEGIHGETDIEAAAAAANHNTNPELAHDVWIQVVPPNPDGEPCYVDGTCSICLLDYEVGDTIIRSTRRECHHAFHDDCILVWLSKGKKRCPICRNWFVPGSKIDDKKVITHDADDVYASSPAGGNVVVADDEEDEEENDIEFDQRASGPQEGRALVLESPPAAPSVSNHAAS